MEKYGKLHLEFISKITQYEQRSDEWFAHRKLHLTSSDAASALGINPYSKPIELLFKKCGAGKPFNGNEATLHGQKYEDEAIEKYALLMGKKNHEFGMIPYAELNPTRTDIRFTSDEYGFLGGSPDGIAEDLDPEHKNPERLVMLEVKCPMRRKIKHGQVPNYYYPQVQLNMFILNLEIADFIEYVPSSGYKKNMELNIVRVHRCEDWFHKNVPILKDFWDSVLLWRERGIENHPEYSKYAYVEPKITRVIPTRPEYLFIKTDEKPPERVDMDECMFVD
jgi:putative phage-type endonuclease